MPEYLSPGVYIEEFEMGAKPIEGVSTSTAGLIGVAEMGPTEGLPELVTSFADFQLKFGGLLTASYGNYRYLPYAVHQFFINGGSRCYIVRVAPSDAVAAENTSVPAGVQLQLLDDARSGDTKIYVSSLRGIDKNSKVTLERLKADGTIEAHDDDVDVNTYDSSKNEVTLASGLSEDYPKKSTRVKVTKLAGGASASSGTLDIKASSKGDWGEGILVEAAPVSIARTQITEIIGDATTSKKYKVKNKNGFYKGAIVEFDDAPNNEKQYARVDVINDDIITLSRHLSGDGAVVDTDTVPRRIITTCEFSLVIRYTDKNKVERTEVFSDLSMNPDTSNYFMKVVINRSDFVVLESPYASASDFTRQDPFDMPTNNTLIIGEQSSRLCIRLSGGNDGTVSGLTAADFIGKDLGPGKRSGIEAFKDIDEVSILAAPGNTDLNVQLALVSQCENLKDRFAVLDIPENLQKVNDVKAYREKFETSYAAMYHPWIQIYDPAENRDIYIPPSGSIMGIYSRNDQNRGVHKAPANEVVRTATDLKYLLNKGEQDILNPKGVNLIRSFPGRGILVWGARTCSSNTLWKYINVRRLFIYVEESIDEGTQWVVFEPNDDKLWARVKATITEFLTRVWRDGALMGTKAEEAFFVKCDRTTMTDDDINNGRLVCVIGIAPVRPAEFVIFRIAQLTASAKAA
ncbi:MAG TPA: phage tail sheath family protein [Candidatus Methanoperedenaceae archaeon]|nr:phage tail sheath family protein [Candidatus Methanoperedenaceae archaeon]